jgi:hypothetical protein
MLHGWTLNLMLNKRSQSQKITYHMIPFIWDVYLGENEVSAIDMVVLFGDD